MSLLHASPSAVATTRAPGAVVIGGDYQGLGIVRSLGERGVPVCVLDDEPSIARASRYTGSFVRTGTLRDERSTLDALAAVRAHLGQQGWVLYPTRDETVAVIAAHREALLEDFRVPTPAWSAVRQAWDKRATYRLASSIGVPTPRTWFPRVESDLDLVDTDGPLVVKPAIKEHFFYATHDKAWRADGREELRTTFRRAAAIVGDGEVIVQELVPGGGEGQYSYCAFFSAGRAVASMGVRRLRQHPSDFGRASTLVETIDSTELEEPALRFLREIDYYGLVELEFKRDPRDGRLKLLDVNARTWGYHSLGRASGVDFPYLLFRDQLGQSVDSVRARPGVRWIRLATDLPNAVRDLRRGELRLRDYARSLRGIDAEAVFSARDPLPGAYELALLPYLAVRKGL